MMNMATNQVALDQLKFQWVFDLIQVVSNVFNELIQFNYVPTLDIKAYFIELRLISAKPLLEIAINEGVVMWNLPPFSSSSTRCCCDELFGDTLY